MVVVVDVAAGALKIFTIGETGRLFAFTGERPFLLGAQAFFGISAGFFGREVRHVPLGYDAFLGTSFRGESVAALPHGEIRQRHAASAGLTARSGLNEPEPVAAGELRGVGRIVRGEWLAGGLVDGVDFEAVNAKAFDTHHAHQAPVRRETRSFFGDARCRAGLPSCRQLRQINHMPLTLAVSAQRLAENLRGCEEQRGSNNSVT